MASLKRIPLGAPGIYPYPDIPIRSISRVRMDVCAFVGIAPRGPARVPNEEASELPSRRTIAVAIESFDEYRQLYSGFEGPGLMPYAVASFFEQGGKRAYIARIVHDYKHDPDPTENDRGVAWCDVPGVSSTAGPLRLRARNEGAWGNLLNVYLSFTNRQLIFHSENLSLTGIELPVGINLSPGTLLRLNHDDGFREFRFVAQTYLSRLPNKTEAVWTVTFDQAITKIPQTIDIVEATLEINDSAGHLERFERLGLSPFHFRWMATILTKESTLVYPDNAWKDSSFRPDDKLLSVPFASKFFSGGIDRYSDITPDDFFDPEWTINNEEPGNGIQALSQLPDVSLLVVPDLYSPFPIKKPRKLQQLVSLTGSFFSRCLEKPIPPMESDLPLAELVNLRLDPLNPEDLQRIIILQKQMIDFAEQIKSLVVLLDVPPGLTQRRIINWRSQFQSSYAAAYHPWVTVVRKDDLRNVPISLPPSAPAAGIIAQIENTFGISHGPANVIAAQVVNVQESVSQLQHNELHSLGINVYRLERDGVRLTAARTLSADRSFRQLSVRRLLSLLRRALEQQMQWVVFEPNNSALRVELRQLMRAYLRQFFTAGAFRGSTEDESFFVRCDESNNPLRITDLGQLLVEIGVAPSEPLEFILLRLTRDGDGTLIVNESQG